MADNFQNTVESLFKGMENFITTKTVVGVMRLRSEIRSSFRWLMCLSVWLHPPSLRIRRITAAEAWAERFRRVQYL